MSGSPVRRRVRITGLVQGVGFRPFVWQRAAACCLCGWVRNDVTGVTLDVQGPPPRVAQFLDGLAEAAPPRARIDAVDVRAVDVDLAAGDFVILPSDRTDADAAWVGPDLAPCAACLADMDRPGDRRFGYPFTNCTHCGPRFTIVEELPYDRDRTTMRVFAMCEQCAAEYADPRDRRFHAQPNACPACGPQVWLVPPQPGAAPLAVGPAAVDEVRRRLAAGEIVAIKGVGGFHLACDATQEAAVARLRARKRRWAKPLAILAPTLEACGAYAEWDDAERQLLESQERPIVLLRKRAGATTLAPSVAPDNPYVGVMLPDAPLHALLAADGPPLVFTSGNLSEEPIVIDNDDALQRLGPLADALLLHDRAILAPCDDSVVRSVGGQLLPLRRSRGYAPLPVRLPQAGPSVLAVGGELKATCCVTRGPFAFLSQHLGDMENVETLEALRCAADHLRRLFRTEPTCVAADLHPDYLATHWARELARAEGLPLRQFQHHAAHVAALQAEHQVTDERPLLGICFDGTGWGTDGAIWGGEALLCRGAAWERWAHLRYFPLPGGDACAARPYRTALALLRATGASWDERLPCVAACTEAERDVLARQLDRGLNCLPTSSMGRLFDAAAAVLGLRQQVRYEAEAALQLEYLADRAGAGTRRYAFALDDGSPCQADAGPVLAALARDALAGFAAEELAAAFHQAVVDLIMSLAERARAAHGVKRVGLTGGVFQNAWLVRRAEAALAEARFETLVHRLVPPNDAGLALGQAWLAMQ